MHAAKLSAKYQISIPKPIRDELEIKAGQRFVFIPKGNILMLVPQMKLDELAGTLAGANTEGYREHEDRY